MTHVALLLAAASAVPGGYDGELLDFTASWCGPCQQMSPVVSKLHREGLPVRKVDVDRNRDLARKYGVTNIPAFVLVVNGQAVDRVVGMTSESRLREMIARIPQSAPPAVAEDSRNSRGRGRGLPVTPVSSSVPEPSDGDLGLPAAFPGVARANNDDRPAADPADVAVTDDATPLGASVRIRVVDDGGVNFGSATIVESRPGRAVLLSCGHVFRELGNDSTIEVDVFERSADGRVTGRETFVGEVVGYDLKADVGLLSIPAERRLPVCPVASVEHRAVVDDSVVSVGCSRGQLPTVQELQVTRLNRYLGPDNLECTGVPVQGRSGGGLFDTEGRVVGVCIAADPRDEEGIYAGPKAIHTLLAQHGLERLVEGNATSERPAETELAADEEAEPEPFDPSFEDAVDLGEANAVPVAATEPVVESLGESVATGPTTEEELAELLDQAGDAEVICIIRRHDEPRSRSRIVVINRASSKFVDYLGGEMREQPQLTSDRREAPASDTARQAERERRLEGSGWRILRKPVAEQETATTPRRPRRPR